MLLRGEGIEQDVMLRANTQDLTEFIHVIEDVDSESIGFTCSSFEEACQD